MTDLDKLKELITDIDFLISHRVHPSAPAFQAWHTNVERYLIRVYGQNSFEYITFSKTQFYPSAYVPNANEISCCEAGLRATKLVFQDYLKEMEEKNGGFVFTKEKAINPIFKKVFIVHGHDGELKQYVARIIEKQEIEAIILSEQANQGRTIIEKFEDYSDVDGAICLFTADDYGREKKDTIDNTRARQNVVLETGYFMGKLGRDHTAILADNGIEMPSDLSGVLYTDTESWQFDLLKELNAMGYEVDLNKLL